MTTSLQLFFDDDTKNFFLNELGTSDPDFTVLSQWANQWKQDVMNGKAQFHSVLLPLDLAFYHKVSKGLSMRFHWSLWILEITSMDGQRTDDKRLKLTFYREDDLILYKLTA